MVMELLVSVDRLSELWISKLRDYNLRSMVCRQISISKLKKLEAGSPNRLPRECESLDSVSLPDSKLLFRNVVFGEIRQRNLGRFGDLGGLGESTAEDAPPPVKQSWEDPTAEDSPPRETSPWCVDEIVEISPEEPRDEHLKERRQRIRKGCSLVTDGVSMMLGVTRKSSEDVKTER
ncbi:hypothetical protein K402DRAFT_401285 [Aulographum hederae CBS 113979]|uniref:Uncharacterized protein n=1 Tax=Aulographum hederae CBS 113979 TaxID=1176131 RepID=A0A6G1HB50_9PEZI|nr:hypothetical protein K402DRAFT_401285 [Aulographum hederae CBS 113979]